MRKLFLFDAFALIYRAHFGFVNNPRVNSKGMNTGATFGFTNTILEIINKEKPTHMAVAFDTSKPTFRHENFAEYKANRQKQPEDITLNIPYVKKMLEGLGIILLELDGFEADDIIGTIAKKAENDGFDEIFMMTSDKDYCQLVSEKIMVYKPAFMGKGPEKMTIAKVLEKFNIKNVDQVRDILGLQGDAVDNIPGIPGVGEKTAQKFIEQYGTVEELVKNADQLTGKMRQNVEQFGQQGIISKELATIMINVPVEINWEQMEYKGVNKEILSPLLDELEFMQMKSKLIGGITETPKAKPKVAPTSQMGLFDSPSTIVEIKTEEPEFIASNKIKNINNTYHNYYKIDSLELAQNLAQHLSLQDEFCFDTETDSLDTITAQIVGLSFSYLPTEAYYIPFNTDREQTLQLLNCFKEVLENDQIGKIGHNIKFDAMLLAQYGIAVKGKLFDTMVAHYLIEPDMRHGMDLLAKNYLDYEPVSITELIGKKGKNQGTMWDVDIDVATEYACEDADITLQLKYIFEPKIKENKLSYLFENVEMPLIHVLASMEENGVKVDIDTLGEISQILDVDIKETEKQIYEMAGEEFNISSPKQMGIILFEKLKLVDKPKKTETGQYATGEEILSKLADEHPIINQILEFRELQKLKSTYVDALPNMINEKTGLVHTSYNQTVAATGRLSSTNPNLQNIPIRTNRGKEIRKAFVPRKIGNLILSADYSQIELRIMAEFCQDATMLAAFQNNIDIHSSTASKVFGVSLQDVTSDMRRKAKMVNFGIIYGISAFGLSQRLSIPRKEAAEIIDTYFLEFPAIKTYMDKVINKARENEFVETILGRRRYLRDINSRNQTIRGYAERNAINAPIQGTAADMIKVAMIHIYDWMNDQNLKSKMILQVHDELLFDCVPNEVDMIKEKVSELMKNAIDFNVPMEIGIGAGDNWLEAH